MLEISQIKLPVTVKNEKEELVKKISEMLKAEIRDIKILKKSIDARKKQNIVYVYKVAFNVKNEKKYLKFKNIKPYKTFRYEIKKAVLPKRPIITGFGPGGIFSALLLARAGARPIVFEQGAPVDERIKKVDTFFKTGELDTRSNVQFGEGGAGTFSDGKLNSGINDERCFFVLSELIKHGAPPEIMYSAKPHIGTDKLRQVIKNIRKEIELLGGEIYFNTALTDFTVKNGKLLSVTTEKGDFECSELVLAVGHSARKTFELLYKKGIAVEKKPFAMGVRIEHNQKKISETMYGTFANVLPPADYKLFTHLNSGYGVYTFCMCPGGYIVASSSEKGGVVTNGMSEYARNGTNSNSALLVGLDIKDIPGDGALSGMYFQRELEKRAFEVGGGNYKAPVQLVGDLLGRRSSKEIGSIHPTYPIGVTYTDMRNIFPEFMYEALKNGIAELDGKLPGFADDEAVITAVESRSSSPVRITRGKDLCSVTVNGLYPCAEGCGYAGGIMSAAVDGMKCAEAILEKY